MDLNLADGEKLELWIVLAPQPPPPQPPLPFRQGFGFGIGRDSFALEVWSQSLGLGLSFRLPPPWPDLTQSGSEGIYPWGPEVKFYLAYFPLVDTFGFVFFGSVVVQEVVWVPGWPSEEGLHPSVEVEPEKWLSFYPTFAVVSSLGLSLVSFFGKSLPFAASPNLDP